MAMFAAGLVALLAFRTPWHTLAVAGAKGVWDAIFILYVIWPALLLYQITKQSGAYDALRQGIAHFSRNELFIILALSWVFASFLKGIAGVESGVASAGGLIDYVTKKPATIEAIDLATDHRGSAFGAVDLGRFFGGQKQIGTRLNLAGERIQSYVNGADGWRARYSA